jgi:hypothetical protein
MGVQIHIGHIPNRCLQNTFRVWIPGYVKRLGICPKMLGLEIAPTCTQRFYFFATDVTDFTDFVCWLFTFSILFSNFLLF